ncbi:MAG: UbiD family decarboxylase [Candidatus Binataceae bacterium]
MPDREFFDLRSTLELLDHHGELATVAGEVNWDLELGMLARDVQRRKGPALLFNNIKDYNSPAALCSQLTTGLLGSMRRLSLIFGFEDEQPGRVLMEYVLERNRRLIPPVLVKDGPVHENVITGKDIDLNRLPVPKWHRLDGGRYIGTMGCVVTKDPETGRANVGVYRSMIADRDKMATLLIRSQGWGGHFTKYEAMGQPMPVAWVFGWDPIMDFIASSPIPADVCEYDVMGGYRGEPVRLVKCKTVDLEVPASAEIVIEGHISPDPDSKLPEGPFAEFTQYLSDLPTLRPVVQVSAITHRNQPIFRGTLAGVESTYYGAIHRAGTAWNILRAAGIPGILNCYIQPITNGTTIIVQIKKAYEGQPKQIAAALWGANAANYAYKRVIVVDEDIDPSDPDSVEWAINYRVDFGSDDVVLFRGIFGSPLDPSVPLELRHTPELGTGLWNRVLIDATKTWRFQRRPEWNNEKFPPVATNRPEDTEYIRKNWDKYAIKKWCPDQL